VLLTAVLESSVVLATFHWALEARGLEHARTVAFTVLVCAEVFRALAARSETRLFWEVGAFTNLRLLAVLVLTVVLQLAIVQVPQTRTIFDVRPLTPEEALISLGLGLIPVTALEISKLLRRSLRRIGVQRRRPLRT
jgi:Ca2+-transporting ATPase